MTYHRDREIEKQHRARLRREEVRINNLRLATHLTFKGQVLCGEEDHSIRRIPASSLKKPLTRSLAQLENFHRKALDDGRICEKCHAVLPSLIEPFLERLLASDLDDEITMPSSPLETSQ